MPEQEFILFTDLSQYAELKKTRPIDGVSAGTFFSFWGGEFTITSDDLKAMVANTNKMLKSTRDSEGEIVGLPIDMEGHDHRGGAGWIINTELDENRDIILFYVSWTDQGKEVIRENLTRFFSPSLDLENKLVMGGSLTNYPASRDAKGHILLRPVELSKSLKEIDMDFSDVLTAIKEMPAKVAEAVKQNQTPVELSQPPAPAPAPQPKTPAEPEGVSPELKAFLDTPEGVEELGKAAAKVAAEKIKLERRKDRVVEFASKMVAGTKERPFGLRVRAQDLVAFTLSLSEKQEAAFMKMMDGLMDAAVDFAQHGTDLEGFIQRPKLEGGMLELARNWVKDGNSIQKFFEVNPELGSIEDFDVTEFTMKKEA